ncbi:MAG TPA: hypothetical protein VLH60_05095 [Sedimentisphaerales bacterium]|nr:hypothetical protein [Sedimentisphaerales bacterium]
MTLPDARAWATEVVKQRYEWIGMIFGKGEEGAGGIEDQYCRACKAAKQDDCTHCDRKVQILRDDRKGG